MIHETLQQARESGIITEPIAKGLEKLTPGTWCHHRSWGYGCVNSWNLEGNKIVIDFEGKSGHPMQLAYAVESLKAFPPDDIRARVRTEPDVVAQLAEQDPVSLVRTILENLGGKAKVDEILSVLVPKVFDAAKAKRWWEAARKKLRADGQFHLPAKKTDPVELHKEKIPAHTALISKFRSARHLKDQVSALDHLMKSLDDFAHEVAELQTLARHIEDAAAKGQKLQAAHAIELLLARDEILARHESLRASDSAPTVADILRAESARLPELFAALPASKQKAVLESFEQAFGDQWQEKAFALMLKGNARLASEIDRLFQRKGLGDIMEARLARWIAERSVTSEVLYWLCKERGANYKSLFTAPLFGAVLSALEMDALSEKKSMRLRDLIIDDAELPAAFFENASREVVRDALRRLMLTTVFDDINKRSLIGRMIKQHPHLQAMVSGESGQEDESLTVSWASLEKRKAEFDDIVNRLIPQNVRDIATAREYGDLRENFEFKSAKEQQAVLARRKAELERSLALARGTNFENVDTSSVSIGTTVKITDLASGQSEQYSILGAWDSAPERGIVSYKAAIGQALLGKAVGETADVGGGRTVRVDSIAPFTNLALLAEIHRSETPAASAASSENPETRPA